MEKMDEKWGKVSKIIGILVISVMLGGCYAKKEPQNRNYIMCMGIDIAEKGWRISYSFPDLAQLTGTDAQEAEPVRIIEADSVRQAAERLGAVSDKITDYSQLSVILVSEELYTYDEKMQVLVDELTSEKAIKRTAMIGITDEKAESIVELDDKVNGSIGVFLYELCQNNYEDRGYDLCILEDLAGGRYSEECVVPVFEEWEERPKLVRMENYGDRQ